MSEGWPLCWGYDSEAYSATKRFTNHWNASSSSEEGALPAISSIVSAGVSVSSGRSGASVG